MTRVLERAAENGSPASFETARVRDAMHPGVITCSADTPLRMVAWMMAENRIHSVVVTGINAAHGDHLWGIITDADIMRAARTNLDVRTAGDSAATEPLTIRADESLVRAAQLMSEHELTHLVVVEPASGHPAGMLSGLDVTAMISR